MLIESLILLLFSYNTTIIYNQYMDKIKNFYTKQRLAKYSYIDFITINLDEQNINLLFLPLNIIINILIMIIILIFLYILLVIILARFRNNQDTLTQIIKNEIFTNFINYITQKKDILIWFIITFIFNIILFVMFIILIKMNIIKSSKFNNELYVSTIIHNYITIYYISSILIFFVIINK